MKNRKMEKSNYRKFLKMDLSRIAFLFFVAFVMFVINGCEKEEIATLPVATTIGVSDVLDIEAKVSGNVTSNGGAKILAMGICWTTNDVEPTIVDKFVPAGEFTKNGILEEDWNYSITLKGLTAKTNYKVRAYAVNDAGVAYGATIPFTSKAGKTFHVLTPGMIDTYTQEIWEGPKQNLIDGDVNTFWHSAWSGDPGAEVKPLPHHIQITFPEAKYIGGFKFWTRSASKRSIDPAKFDLQTSTNGTDFKTVWTSGTIDAKIRPAENLITLDKNYSSKYFRLRILDTRSPGQTCTTIGELAIFEDGLLPY